MYPCQTASVKFQHIREIGQHGRNSKVFLSHDQNLQADLVIKEVSKSSLSAINDFFNEARSLYKSYHPNVVQILYVAEDATSINIAMPYYKNGSIKDLIAVKKLTVKQIVRYSTHFLSGLHNIHSKGLIHFDIKPDNLMLSDRDEALVSDFGLVNLMDTSGCSSPTQIYGKQIPPECLAQIIKGVPLSLDNKYDIYQSGLTIFRMCVGDTEFDSQYQRHFTAGTFQDAVLKGNFPDLSVLPLHIPKRLKAVIVKCLKLNPAERYQSAIEIVNALADIDGSILNWEHTYDGVKHVWKNDSAGYTYLLEVTNDKSSVAYKQKEGGAKRRIPEFCLPSISDVKIKSFFDQQF